MTGSAGAMINRKFLWSIILLTAFLLIVLAGGCGEKNAIDRSVDYQQLAYLSHAGSTSRIMVADSAKNIKHPLLEWSENNERYSYNNDGRYFTPNRNVSSSDSESRSFVISNDGRYLAAGLVEESLQKMLVIGTDGGAVWEITGADDPAFSPDSKRAAFTFDSVPGPSDGDDNRQSILIIDVDSGAAKFMAIGENLHQPEWVDDHTVVCSRRSDGTLWKIDIANGLMTQLTFPPYEFQYQPPSAGYKGKSIAITESRDLGNVWSLDLQGGELLQITNTLRYESGACYLPDSNLVLFESRGSMGDINSSELIVVADDGSEQRMLTSNSDFDGLATVSPDGDMVAYQHEQDGETSILVDDLSGDSSVVEKAGIDGWLGDPAFIRDDRYNSANPLTLTVSPGLFGLPQLATVTNSLDTLQTVKIAFSSGYIIDGRDYLPGYEAGESEKVLPTGDYIEMSLDLGPREALTFPLGLDLGDEREGDANGGLLLTLTVAGAPPIMWWGETNTGLPELAAIIDHE